MFSAEKQQQSAISIAQAHLIATLAKEPCREDGGGITLPTKITLTQRTEHEQIGIIVELVLGANRDTVAHGIVVGLR